jgi:hypothetical protein
MAGLGDRLQGGPLPPGMSLGDRLQQAFDAARAMQEPSRALYEAKHRRAQEYLGNEPPPPELSWEDFASIGSRALGGAQKMWQMAPAAAGALWNDPLGSINRAGLAGQAATDAIIRGAGEPFTQFGDPNVDPAKQGADLALAAMGGSATIPAEENALRMGIKAYHGSPHSFDKFDSSKIGTGEGAQAYGYGLYAAENEAVAKQYRDLLGTRSSAVGDPVARAQFWASDLGSREAAVTHLEGVLKQAESRPKNFEAGDLEKTRQAIDYLKSGGDLMPKSGHMYEVDIAADPEHFLDWDKPLSEQSPQVQQAALGTAQPPDPGALRKRAETATGAEKDFLLNQASYLENQLKMHGEGWHGSAVAENLPSEWDDFETARRIARAKVAEQLKERGAAGIRYLDQGSRVPNDNFVLISPKQGQIDEWTVINRQTGNHELFKDEAAARDYYEKQTAPTRNFVIFPGNEHLIAILKKYGLPISAAGLAALSQLHPQEAEAQPLGDRLQGRSQY